VSFGPRDLRDEVDDYVAARQRGDDDAAARRAKELLEADASGRGAGLRDAVEEAIFVQANNRIFGVIFWFMVLGPAGAWLFRVSDLLRRRAAFQGARGDLHDSLGRALVALHGLLAWIPARLAAVSYALAGSLEDAVGNWPSVDRAAERARPQRRPAGPRRPRRSSRASPTCRPRARCRHGAWCPAHRVRSTWIGRGDRAGACGLGA
jgi:membrane protein required for beta-lactamase induction